MSSIKVTNLQAPSAASPAIVLAADGSATAQLSSLNGGALSGARNRIINGDMRIDARNAGASVTPATGTYTVDRWLADEVTDGSATVQQSTTAPPGFTNSLLATVTSADSSLAATQYMAIKQRIEGFNTADLAWGSASALAVTLSFWVRSSLTGTFGGALTNGSFDRSYPFSYTIASANTWTYVAVTIPGSASGTWATNSALSIEIFWGLGVGSAYSGAAGSWANAGYIASTGATSVIGTNGATFYITGVQLEAGTVATPFERRSYGQELALCQRYFFKSPGGTNLTNAWGSMYANNAGRVWSHLPVPTRVAGTLTTLGSGFERIGIGGVNGTIANVVVSTHAISFDGTALAATASFGQPFAYLDSFTVSAEL